MALTVSNMQRISDGNKWKIIGTCAFDVSYPTGGESLTAAMLGLVKIDNITVANEQGYLFEYDYAAYKVKAYAGGEITATGSINAEAAHTHAIALDGGATGGGSSHSHGVTLAASAAGSSHNHAATPGGTIDAEAAHTHVIALDTGASAAGASHNHVFTGTAITPVNFDVDDNDGAAGDGVLVYVHTNDGTIGNLQFVSPTNVSGVNRLNATGPYVKVLDSDAAATDGLLLYCDEDATDGDRLQCVNPLGTDIYIPATNGQYIKIKSSVSAAADGIQVYFDEDVANTHDRMMFVSPTDTDATNITDAAYNALAPVPTGDNAAEATHTHASGTLGEAACAAGSSHTHAITGLTVTNTAEAAHTHALTGTTIDAEAAHTHDFGTLTEAASAAGSSHTHTFTGSATGDSALNEVDSETNLSALTTVYFVAIGL